MTSRRGGVDPEVERSEWRAQFREEVFPAEMAAIRDRRRARDAALAGQPPPTEGAREDPFDRPSTTIHGLIGLALSGGGMRSASFNLGVLQALHHNGILGSVDYLSTVSGGGWIGAALQSLLREPRAGFPFVGGPRSPSDNDAVSYLRGRADALLPSGTRGGLFFAASMIRGQLATAALLLSMAVLAAAAATPLSLTYLKAAARLTARTAHAVPVAGTEAGPRPGPVAGTAVGPDPDPVEDTEAGPVAGTEVGPDLAPDPGPAVPSVAAPAREEPLESWTTYTRYSRYALAAAALWMILGLMGTFVGRPRAGLRDWLEHSNTFALGVALAAVALELQPFIFYRWAVLLADLDRPGGATPSSFAVTIGAVALPLLSFGPLAANLPRVMRPLGLATAFVVSVGVPYLIFVHLVAVAFRQQLLLPDAAPPDLTLPVLVALGVIWVVGNFNTNEVSLHGFFRDRIARTFILRRKGGAGEGVEPYGTTAHRDDLALSALNRPGSTAPYALINAALNLQATTDRSKSGRQGDFFVFSARYVGSDRTGYCPTDKMEVAVPGMTLATAVAVSAAAASPNMGTYTVQALVVLMTVLNVRLGFWLPHPGRLRRWLEARGKGLLNEWRPYTVWRWYPKVRYFFYELFSRIDDLGSQVYLTDGGHLENTGAYELLRRRCRLIIVSDAEEDRSVNFGAVAALVRYARLDLHTRIDLDLGDLRCNEQGVSRRHAALGVITYPKLDETTPEEKGYLLYLKSSITADEDELIREYRARFGDFPHQSTADQRFDEAQFEAYRALGMHAVDGLFPLDFKAGADADAVEQWVEDLRARLTRDASGDPSFAEMRDELEEVEAMLREPGLGSYFAELYPELATGGADQPTAPEALFAVVTRQIHLMATVFNHLGLDVPDAHRAPRSQGWMNVFRRWAAAPTFRRHWLVVVHTQSDAFGQFGEAALALPITVQWREVDAAALTTEAAWAATLLGGAATGARFHLGQIEVRDIAGPTVFAARTLGSRVDDDATREGYGGARGQRARQALERELRGGS